LKGRRRGRGGGGRRATREGRKKGREVARKGERKEGRKDRRIKTGRGGGWVAGIGRSLKRMGKITRKEGRKITSREGRKAGRKGGREGGRRGIGTIQTPKNRQKIKAGSIKSATLGEEVYRMMTRSDVLHNEGSGGEGYKMKRRRRE
jgi:hypothetical protein